MSQGRDDSGRFERKVREQDILKVFDYADEPMLTASEIAGGLQTHFEISVTAQAVRNHLQQMAEKELVSSKEFGARAIGWRALVAPELDDDVATTVDERQDTDRNEFVALDS